MESRVYGEREQSVANVPAQWPHPDDGPDRSGGGGGSRRTRTLIIAGGVLALIILLVLLILLIVAFVRLNKPACQSTKPYFVSFLDEKGEYKSQLSDPSSKEFAEARKSYEKSLEKTVNDAGYNVYDKRVSYFRQGSTVRADSNGLLVSGSFSLEAEWKSMPDNSKLQSDIASVADNWIITHVGDDLNAVCESPFTDVPKRTTSIYTGETTTATGSTAQTGTGSTVTETGSTTTGTGTSSESTTVTQPSTTSTTTDTPVTYPNSCVDIMFILDESETVKLWHSDAFGTLKEFMINITRLYKVGQKEARFSVVGFGGQADVQLRFTDNGDRHHVEEVINNIEIISLDPESGSRNTGAGLQTAVRHFDQTERQSIQQLAILVITQVHDEDSDPVPYAREIARKGIPLLIAPISFHGIENDYRKEVDALGQYGTVHEIFDFPDLMSSKLTEDLLERVQNQGECPRYRCPSDVVFLIDQSTSVGNFTYEHQVVPFMVRLAGRLDVSKNKSHLAMVHFSSPENTDVSFDLTTSYDIKVLQTKIAEEDYKGGNTAMEKALNLTYDVLQEGHGGRPHTKYADVSQIAIMITDGRGTDTGEGSPPPYASVQHLLDQGVHIIAVGVGDQVDFEYLEILTGNHSEYVFQVSKFEQLMSLLGNITDATACMDGTPTPPPTLPPCHREQLDVLYLIEDTFDASKDEIDLFFYDVTSAFNIGPDNVRIAIMKYNAGTDIVAYLNDLPDAASAKQKVYGLDFSRPAVSPLLDKALNTAQTQVLITEKNDRSCIPDVIIVLSYSEIRPEDVRSARVLRNLGTLVVGVGVGNKPGPNLELLSSPSYSFRADNFTVLDYDLANLVAQSLCNFQPESFYPCDMEQVQADVVFIVDTTKALDSDKVDGVVKYVENYLVPYRFGKEDVRAALVTYTSTATTAIFLDDTNDIDEFLKKLKSAVKTGTDSQRNISAALETTVNKVFDTKRGYRQNVPHVAVLFMTDCSSNNDEPAVSAARLREKALFYVVTLDTPTVSAKELLQLHTETSHIHQLKNNIQTVLPDMFSEVSWQFTCDIWTSGYTFNILKTPMRSLKPNSYYHDKLEKMFRDHLLRAEIIDVYYEQEGALTEVKASVVFGGYTRFLTPEKLNEVLKADYDPEWFVTITRMSDRTSRRA